MIFNAQGEVFVTGSCTSEIGYFRIKLNVYDSVETVTCINRKTFQVRNMIALYGKHESMLNELKFRFRVRTNDNIKSDLLNFSTLRIYTFLIIINCSRAIRTHILRIFTHTFVNLGLQRFFMINLNACESKIELLCFRRW